LKVRTSHDTIEEFSKSKIVRALVNEADAPIAIAEKIADEVENYLARIEVAPSTTMIREMVNAKLIEYGFDDIASYHQRLGLPIYDVKRLVTMGYRMESSTQFNPESIHKHMGDMIARSYALNAVIPGEVADAHRQGLINIHELEYFVTRPYCFCHDPRYFLRGGLRVDGSGRDTATSGPAKHPEVAIFHAAKALAASQVFWSGGQGYNHFNVFMAPYFTGKNDREVSQLCQVFVYEMSQQYVARGGQMVFSSVSLSPGIPGELGGIRAVKPGGIVGPETYSDYHDESLAIFRGMMGVLLEGDHSGKPFPFPRVEIRVVPGMLKSAEREYMMACELAAKFGSPVFLNQGCGFVGAFSSSVESRLIADGSSGYPESIRGGILQEVTINMPRVAFESRGREGKFFEILGSRMDLAKKILTLKMEIIDSRMKEGSLSFAAQPDGESSYLELGNQGLLIGILGLNEAVKSLSGDQLHESGEALSLGETILERMGAIAGEYSREEGKRFEICQSPSIDAQHRLATIDRKIFRSRFVAQGESSAGSLYYTTGAHVQATAEVPLEEMLEISARLQRLLVGGSIMDVWLDGVPSAELLYKMVGNLARSEIPLFGFSQDLTLCLSCGATGTGLGHECRICGSREVDWISRLNGEVSRVGIGDEIGGWNPGAREQLLSRRRYSL